MYFTLPNCTLDISNTEDRFISHAPCTRYRNSVDEKPQTYGEPGAYTCTYTELQDSLAPHEGGNRKRAHAESARRSPSPAPTTFPSATRTEGRNSSIGGTKKRALGESAWRSFSPAQSVFPSPTRTEGRTYSIKRIRKRARGESAGHTSSLAPSMLPSTTRTEGRTYSVGEVPRKNQTPLSRANCPGGNFLAPHCEPSTRAFEEEAALLLHLATSSAAEESPSKGPCRKTSASHDSLFQSLPGQNEDARCASGRWNGVESIQEPNRVHPDHQVQTGFKTAKARSSSDEAEQQSRPHLLVDSIAATAQANTMQGTRPTNISSQTHAHPEQSTSSDWEPIVDMYFYGYGTVDGIPLRDIPKFRIKNRTRTETQLLDRQRAIGETYEELGKVRFDLSIGYGTDGRTGLRRKRGLSTAVDRCRVVRKMKKAMQEIPSDGEMLSQLIDERIAEKRAGKEPTE